MKGAYCKTPLVIIKRMFELVNVDFTNPNKTLIDPCMGTGSFLLYAKEQYMIGLKSFIEDDIDREKYILENILFGYDIDRIKVNMANILLNKNNYKCNLYRGDALKLHNEYKDMKFDYMISNPPFNNNLDLKIIKEVYPLVSDDGKMCFIHPAGWLYDKKGNKLYNSMKELLKDDLYGYEIIPAIEFNKIFNIHTMVDSSITLFKINDGKISYNQIYQHGYNTQILDIHKKSQKYCAISNMLQYMVRINNKSYEVGFASVRGNTSSNDFFTFIQITDPTKSIGMETKFAIKYGFDTELEARNFLEYCKLKVIRLILSIVKINQNLDRGELEYLPYLPTYTHEWTDEMVAKELGLTDEELRWAINWIPDYYPDDSERYAKYFDPEQKERYLINEKVTYGGYKPL